jgi:hypothetical protein
MEAIAAVDITYRTYRSVVIIIFDPPRKLEIAKCAGQKCAGPLA